MGLIWDWLRRHDAEPLMALYELIGFLFFIFPLKAAAERALRREDWVFDHKPVFLPYWFVVANWMLVQASNMS